MRWRLDGLSVSAGPGGKATGARFRLAARDSRNTQAIFVQRCLLPIEIPLRECRQAVATHRRLRQLRQLVCDFERGAGVALGLSPLFGEHQAPAGRAERSLSAMRQAPIG
jgi:hypothetical protein